MIRALIVVFALVLTSAPTAFAEQESLEFSSAEQETLYRQLLSEMRCLVCQNQSLSESGAGLADDLRDIVYRMVRNGASEEEITSFMVERYGDFVLYDPPMKLSTLALWVGPFIVALGGLFFLWRVLLSQRHREPLDESFHERAEQFLSGGDR